MIKERCDRAAPLRDAFMHVARSNYENQIMENQKMMKCPECSSTHINKNGIKRGKQNYLCVDCGRQFINPQPSNSRGYSDQIRSECLKMYVNGMGFRAIERVKGVHHTTVINWVKDVGRYILILFQRATKSSVKLT